MWTLWPALLMTACRGGDVEPDRPGPAPLIDLSQGPVENVLVLTFDTMRKDVLRRHGGDGLTPVLDELFELALVLDDHRSCSNWTLPAIIALWAGQTPLELGVEPISVNPDAPRYTDEMAWFPSALAERGVQSWLVNANEPIHHWLTGPEAVAAGLEPGFDPYVYEDDAPAARMVDLTLQLLDEQLDRPWWGHVQLFDPHSPFDAPEEYLGALEGLDPIPFDVTDEEEIWQLHGAYDELDPELQADVLAWTRAAYDAEVTYMDHEVGRLWDGLQERGVLDDTLVVLWSDHGEQFWEHGRFMHDMSMNREEVDLAVAFVAPGLEPGTWSGPTTQADLLPTLTCALGWQTAPHHSGTPVGLASDDRERVAFRYKGQEDEARLMVEQDGGRLLYAFVSGERSYYRSDEDPQELVDLYDPEDPDVIALWERMTPHIELVQEFLPFLETTAEGP